MGLKYDVTYGPGRSDFDPEVGQEYLDRLPALLRPGEVAYARCINGSHDHDCIIRPLSGATCRCGHAREHHAMGRFRRSEGWYGTTGWTGTTECDTCDCAHYLEQPKKGNYIV